MFRIDCIFMIVFPKSTTFLLPIINAVMFFSVENTRYCKTKTLILFGIKILPPLRMATQRGPTCVSIMFSAEFVLDCARNFKSQISPMTPTVYTVHTDELSEINLIHHKIKRIPILTLESLLSEGSNTQG